MTDLAVTIGAIALAGLGLWALTRGYKPRQHDDRDIEGFEMHMFRWARQTKSTDDGERK